MPTKETAAQLRASLEEERTTLQSQLSDLDVDGADNSFDENFADSGQVAAEQGESKALANSFSDTLNDVERALQKLDDGTYGACEVCAKDIGDARLEAMPSARYCIDHASGA